MRESLLLPGGSLLLSGKVYSFPELAHTSANVKRDNSCCSGVRLLLDGTHVLVTSRKALTTGTFLLCLIP